MNFPFFPLIIEGTVRAGWDWKCKLEGPSTKLGEYLISKNESKKILELIAILQGCRHFSSAALFFLNHHKRESFWNLIGRLWNHRIGQIGTGLRRCLVQRITQNMSKWGVRIDFSGLFTLEFWKMTCSTACNCENYFPYTQWDLLVLMSGTAVNSLALSSQFTS